MTMCNSKDVTHIDAPTENYHLTLQLSFSFTELHIQFQPPSGKTIVRYCRFNKGGNVMSL